MGSDKTLLCGLESHVVLKSHEVVFDSDGNSVLCREFQSYATEAVGAVFAPM